MAKKIVKKIKVQAQAGKATPAGTLGPALGQAGVNIGDFVNRFNEQTRDLGDTILPVVISVYEDRSFNFVVKTPLTSKLILAELGQEKGSGTNLTKKAGKLTNEQLRKIAELKLPDLNTNNIEEAMKVVAGTARSMGVEVGNSI